MNKNVKIFTDMIEDAAKKQIEHIAELDAFKDAKIRIMPDVHAGKGCVCGFTADLGDKVVPNLIGVDIGCGLLTICLGKVDIDFEKLDRVIRRQIPSGMTVNGRDVVGDHRDYVANDCDPKSCLAEFTLKEYDYFDKSLMSLGGGNHFCEIDVDKDGNKYLIIHCGSRNFGKKVCDYWQNVAVAEMATNELGLTKKEAIKQKITELKAVGKFSEIKAAIDAISKQYEEAESKQDKDLAYLESYSRDGYIHDMKIAQRWASLNRRKIGERICKEMGWTMTNVFETVHNYLGDDNIIRKSAISAKKGERVLIPLNMRDGSIIAIGKGNEDWNNSAPHGAGRLMSRAKARETIDLAAYEKSMEGIFTTSVSKDTIDEAPFAYKSSKKIIEQIADTVDVVEVIKPVYNFKASE